MVLASAVTALIRKASAETSAGFPPKEARGEESSRECGARPVADERLHVFVFLHLKKFDFWQHTLLVKLESSSR